MVKSMAFARVFTNALTGCEMGAAVGGADFNPMNKSEAEIQRFCQAYMTELSKYIGPDQDLPGVGTGVGAREIGYLYGQYKRMSIHHAQKGKGLLWGGVYPFPQATASGVVHWAARVLEGKGDSLEGKRCLITGSGKMALHVAEKLVEMGAVPLTLSDTSGHVYEPDGIDAAKLKTIMKIKSERGARIGRYIIASTTAKYNEPENVFSVPADLVFPCATHNEIDGVTATMLADMGVQGVFEGSHMPCTNQAISIFKKRGILHGGHVATLAADSIFNGLELSKVSRREEGGGGRDRWKGNARERQGWGISYGMAHGIETLSLSQLPCARTLMLSPYHLPFPELTVHARPGRADQGGGGLDLPGGQGHGQGV
jgi:glutamate dehydrogenase (NADP+)